MSGPRIEEQFDALSPADQLDLVLRLWERIASRPDMGPIPPAHVEELNRRLEDHDRDPDDVIEWEEFDAVLRSSS